MKKKWILIFLSCIVPIILLASFAFYPKEVSLRYCFNYDESLGEIVDERTAYINIEEENIIVYDANGRIENKYNYNGFPMDINISDNRDNVESLLLYEDYVIVSFKNKSLYHSFLKDHIEDQLIELDDNNNNALVLNSCSKNERIIYGNNKELIVFDGVDNSIKIINNSQKEIIKTIKLKTNIFLPCYDFEVVTDEEIIIIKEYGLSIITLPIGVFNLNDYELQRQ